MTEDQKQDTGRYEVVVIGGGIGGYEAAIQSAKSGLKTAIVEKEGLGGTGLKGGCLATKYLLSNARFIKKCVQAKKRGMVIQGMGIDLPQMMRNKNLKLRQQAEEMRTELERAGVDVYTGLGQVYPDKRVDIILGDQVCGTLMANHIILATGSHGVCPKAYSGLPNVITDEEAHEMETIPEELVIIGGGINACEYATLFSVFGSKVTLFVEGDVLIKGMDSVLLAAVEKSLTDKNVVIQYQVKVSDVYKDSLGDIHLDVTGRGGNKTIICSDIMVMTSRVANVDGLEPLSLNANEKGILVDEQFQTSCPGIYAVGDVTAVADRGSTAVAMAKEVVAHIISGATPLPITMVPQGVKTLPELAWVGVSEHKAKVHYAQVLVKTYPLKNNVRAFLEDATNGFVRVIYDPKTGSLLGVQIMGDGAAEIITQAQIILSLAGKATDLEQILHGYPTRSSALSEAVAGLSKSK